jgi:S-adenosylmethionine synthetase
MQALVISPLEDAAETVEVVERKGLGHPDTICDALAETLSRNLCREYRRRFGEILHHNVDKALLCGGRAAPRFGGGSVLAPIEIHLGGRATSAVGNDTLPITEILVEGSRTWLRTNLHALDAEDHVRIHNVIQPGSQELRTLFARRSSTEIALANDTSVGVGYAPMSQLERLVLAVEQRINARNRDQVHPAWGEDVKVMGVRNGRSVQLTVACALIGRHIAHLDDYLNETSSIERVARELIGEHGLMTGQISVNSADEPSTGNIYLTVTGTSAEAGDDGQVGRGNRVNGLITPGRPMSLEAAAGKNPVTHVGKIYNVLACQIAETLVAEIPQIAAAHCLMVSQIGAPVTSPALVDVKLATRDGIPVAQLQPRVEEITAANLNRAPKLTDDFVDGAIDIF